MYWSCERDILKQIRLYLDKVNNNSADYLPKFFTPIIHHQQQTPYVHYAHIMKSHNWHLIQNTVRLCICVLDLSLSYQAYKMSHNL